VWVEIGFVFDDTLSWIFAFHYLCLLSTLYSLLLLILPFLEQGICEFTTGPSEACIGDGYCYALDLNDMYDPDIIYGGWDE
jgi:hypothetical protein